MAASIRRITITVRCISKEESSSAPREPRAAEQVLRACMRVVGTATERRLGEEVGGLSLGGDPPKDETTKQTT